MQLTTKLRYKVALRAAGVHFFGTFFVGVLAAALVFGVWYPFPYRELAGGSELFVILVVVDIICGPLLTLILFNPIKSRLELFLDISLIVVIQSLALGYGLYSVAQARPIYLVFEVDRFRVISVADIQPESLNSELGGLHVLPWNGPKIIGTRDPHTPYEKMISLDLSLQGIEPSARPDWWQDYELNKQQVLAKAQLVGVLRTKHPSSGLLIDQSVAVSERPETGLGWLPLTSFNSSSWVVFVDLNTAEVLAFAPLDGF